MEKSKVTMSNWKISQSKDKTYNLSGTADNHPKLGKDTFVAYTSPLEHYEINDDVLTYETRNTIYLCPLKYMDTNFPFTYRERQYVDEIIERNTGDDILEKIVKAEAEISLHRIVDFKYNKETNEYDELREASYSDFTNYIINLAIEGKKEIEEKKKIDEERMINFLLENKYEDSIYLEVSNIDCGDKLAYSINTKEGTKTGVVYPYVHSGMFQDSVLYGAYEILDFRYWPNWSGMSTYHWSDSIKNAYIKNISNKPFEFNGERIEVGETKHFTSKGAREGLLSPDCVDGSSLLSEGIKKEEEE